MNVWKKEFRKNSQQVADNTCGFRLEKYKSHENRFSAIYFVDHHTGSVLVSNTYSDIPEANEDLISSFLSAMNLFMKEIKADGDEEIQEINFRDTRILYERKGRLLTIGISKKTDLHIERTILKEITYNFYQRFQHQIDDFMGVIDPQLRSYQEKMRAADLGKFLEFSAEIK